ncbi:unnamed protein product [Rhizoctonia solani]|uniref:Uncharacterized protein n=1 Tax=Rhizoctonia solani TaxID=456999 RepID=A0A8H3H7T7_9AGAM|nr:unnamed protein product [Rhizoctonia solani]
MESGPTAEDRKALRALALPGASAYRGSVYRGSVRPGASVHPSVNVAIKTIRKKGKIQELAMSFDSWTKENDTFNWYEERKQAGNGRGRYIRTMHLRKERDAPFYHEFVVLHLDDGTFWRIDRRQLKDEQDPYSCIKECGVQACDTIERVSGMTNFLEQNPITSSSNCMVELEFKKDVDVALVLRICRAIKSHKKANVYTLQRYNCFFFAQALIMCTACGVSDWAGTHLAQKQGESEGLWKSPNVEFPNLSNVFDLGNKDRLDSFRWNPSDNFAHNWGELSRLSNTLVHASPLLRHADHCNYCLQSQTEKRQRSMSSEINRLKHRLVIYWNNAYRELLDKAYLENRKTLVNSGVWEVVLENENMAAEGCEKVLDDNRGDITKKWEAHSQNELDKLLVTVRDLLDPVKVCEAWYPDPDEWGSDWRCKDGGPVKAAMEKWETETRTFIGSVISKLEEELKIQTTQAGTKAQGEAMRARLNSFTASMNIKIRIPECSKIKES